MDFYEPVGSELRTELFCYAALPSGYILVYSA
jgi:hypothetical protein